MRSWLVSLLSSVRSNLRGGLRIVPCRFDICETDLTMKRCGWATADVDVEYHDKEWGVPVHDDRHLFERGLGFTAIDSRRMEYGRTTDENGACARKRRHIRCRGDRPSTGGEPGGNLVPLGPR